MKTPKFTTEYNANRKRVMFIGAGFIVIGILTFVGSLFFPPMYTAILSVLGEILAGTGTLIIALGIIFFERRAVELKETEDKSQTFYLKPNQIIVGEDANRKGPDGFLSIATLYIGGASNVDKYFP